MPLINFATNSYRSRSLPLSAQRMVNLFAENQPQDTVTPIALFGAPGLTQFCPSPNNKPVRAMRVMHGLLYFVSGGELYSVTSDGIIADLGNVGAETGPIMMSDNGAQLYILNNQEAYILSVSITSTLGPVGSEQGTILVGSQTFALDDLTVGMTAFVVGYTQTVLRWKAGDTVSILLSTGNLHNTTLALDVQTATIYVNTTLTNTVDKYAIIVDVTKDIIQYATASSHFGDNFVFVQSCELLEVNDLLDITYTDGTVHRVIITALSRGPLMTINDPIPAFTGAGAPISNTTTRIYKVEDINFYPADTVTYFDNYFVLNRSGTNEFFISAVGDGTTYPPLAFANAQVNPDIVVAVVAVHEVLCIVGERSIERWYNAGAAIFPFQRYDGSVTERGCIAPLSIIKEDNTLFLLGDDKIFYKLEGVRPLRVSTHAIETAWSRYPRVDDAFSFSYTTEGHKFVVLTFPSGMNSWVFDITTNLWHERDSLAQGSQVQSIGRWRGNCSVIAYGLSLIGDLSLQGIAKVDWTNFLEFGTQIIGQCISPPYRGDRKRIFVSRFELEMDVGNVGSDTFVFPAITVSPVIPSAARIGSLVIDQTADPQVPNITTQVMVDAIAGQEDIFVQSIEDMGVGDEVQIWLDDGSVFITTIIAFFDPHEPHIYLDYSKDGGYTFSKPQLPRSMGTDNNTLKRLRWLRLGQSRQWYFRLTVSDPCRRVLIAAYADFTSGMG